MIRVLWSTLAILVLGAPAAACDLTRTVIDTYDLPADERNAALTACIADGGDVNEAPDGFGVLTLVVSHQNTFAVRAFLDAGANPNGRDNDGISPVSMAAALPDTDQRSQILRLLVDKGANLNVEDSTEFTPLSYAIVDRSTPRYVAALIDLGADPSYRNSQGESALAFTVFDDCSAAVRQVLLDAGARLDDMAPTAIPFHITRAKIDCSDTPEDRAFLAQLLETAKP